MEGPIEPPTPADLQNAVEAAGQQAAEEAERAARKVVAEMALQLARGTVTARDADGKVQIERPHNDDPDDAFYQVVGSPVVPVVGQEVFGATHSGGIVVWGMETKSDLVPVSSVIEYAGTTEPVDGKWLFCDGRALERADYPELFAAVGTTYATGGETVTQFRIPDHRGRVGMGANPAGAGGLPIHPLGERFGEETHLMVLAEMPAHSHTITVNDDTHNHVASTGTNSHNHSLSSVMSGWSVTNRDIIQDLGGGGLHDVPMSFSWTTHTATGSDSHTHGITVNNDTHSHSATGASVGGSTAHNNNQPSLATNFLIRAKP